VNVILNLWTDFVGFWMDPYSWLILEIRTILGPLIAWPFSSLVATATAMICVFVSRISSNILMNKEKIEAMLREIGEWEERRKAAIEKKDIKAYRQILRSKPRIDRLKNQLAAERMRGSIVSMVLWFILFKFMSDIFRGEPVVVFPLFGYSQVNFAVWYIVISLWFAPLLNRLLEKAS